MKDIIKEWCHFCENKKLFEDGYFYNLFLGRLEIKEIEIIYQYFNNSSELIDRMNSFVFSEVEIINDLDIKKNTLKNLIQLDFEERKPILKDLPNFDVILNNPSFTYTDDFNLVSNFILDDIWSQNFHDYLRTQKETSDKKTFELYNALYGLTTDFDYSMYLFKPLLKSNYSLNNLYRFKRLGGIYAFTEIGIFYTLKPSP